MTVRSSTPNVRFSCHHAVRVACFIAAVACSAAKAVDLNSTQTGQVVEGAVSMATNPLLQTGLAASSNDATLAKLWGITVPEVQRARALMLGPRGAFSSPQISPLEILGIHARNDAERERYARLFAAISYDDTQRMLLWSKAGEAEIAKLTAGMQVLDFSNLPKASASFEAADMVGVPRTAVIPPVKRTREVPAVAPVSRQIGRAVKAR
jgi:hypothetical protein